MEHSKDLKSNGIKDNNGTFQTSFAVKTMHYYIIVDSSYYSAMQNDEVIWQVINYQFCSFKCKVAKEHTFCQNPYNVSGLCIRSACPLANSRYATIREEDGICVLYMKTIERAHTPKNLWEKIKLPANYGKALEIVSQQLEFFPKYLVHRNKQRLTKIHQMLIRMRKLRLKAKPKIVTTNTKVEQREKGRERKALRAAQLDVSIEKELLERLKQVSEGEIYNYPEKQYSKALNKAGKFYSDEEGKNEEDEEDMEDDEGNEIEDEEEDEEEDSPLNIEYVEDFEPSDDEEDMEDTELLQSSVISKRKSPTSSINTDISTKRGKGAKGTRVKVEYEVEEEDEEEDSGKYPAAIFSCPYD
eukprot:gene5464-10991_t